MTKADKAGRGGGPGKRASGYKGFNLDEPELPDDIKEKALTSGGYPYDKKLKKGPYADELEPLQIELLKLQAHVQKQGERIVVLLEGRDAAGKGGTINAIMQHLNPRHAHAVALTKPTQTEAGQWYFQRYAAHLPTKGDLVLFDRSWYNRAGVERVMGFCSPEQVEVFLREAPQFEGMLVRDGIRLFKFFLTIGREAQLERFHERRHDPLKQWKLTDIDRAAIGKWDAYTEAQEDLFRFTHTSAAPWTAIRFNDQRRGRLEAIRVLLSAIDYKDKDKKVVGKPDPKIVGSGPGFFDGE
ncbi:MAG: polyphosphate kinase 2 [Hyphomicrobiaceae bacterium]|nr:polyphosphate kinase 2 [Hyphomicrobiaceae bacterium]